MPVHRSTTTIFRLAGVALLSALLLSACNLTRQMASTPTQEPSVPLALPTQPAIVTVQPEATIAPTEVIPSATLAPTEIPKALGLYSGFIVLKDARLTGYDFDGNFNGFQAEAVGIQYISPYNASVYRDGVVMAGADGGGLNILAAGGSTPISFIAADAFVSAAISADGQQLAWAFETWTEGANAPVLKCGLPTSMAAGRPEWLKSHRSKTRRVGLSSDPLPGQRMENC